jgi:DNA helicase-2/ATP-dependent DNA helicase PcrA
MPHHRRALDDRHSLAPASRFLTADVLGVLDVEELTPPRPDIPAYAGAARVRVDLDGLWH